MTNKLIEKLAVQSLVEYDGELIFSKEKFAELIVKECCSIADEVERADTGMFASKYIRAHFGVEE